MLKLCDGGLMDAMGSWQVIGANNNRLAAVQAEDASFLSHQTLHMNGKHWWGQMPRNPVTKESAAGKVNQYAFCSRPRHGRRRFVESSGCERLPIGHVITQLRRHRLTFAGDSVTHQLWLAIWLATQTLHNASFYWPHGAAWHCGRLTDVQREYSMDRALRGATLSATPTAPGNCDDDDILVLQMGLWYNVRMNATCTEREVAITQDSVLLHGLQARVETSNRHRAFPARGESMTSSRGSRGGGGAGERGGGDEEDSNRDGDSTLESLSQAFHAAPGSGSCAVSLSPSTWLPSAADACLHSAHLGVCHQRGKASALDQCALVRDATALAKWVERHRERLPRHVFVLDVPPQLIKDNPHAPPITRLSAPDAGHWRNELLRRIWSDLAPSVRCARYIIAATARAVAWHRHKTKLGLHP